MAEPVAIGIDIGGTNVKAGIVSPDGTIVAQDSVPTQSPDGPDGVVHRSAELVRKIETQAGISPSDVCGAGVGCPGPLSPTKGVIYETANMVGWDHYPLRDRLSEALGMPVAIDNDANAAALGEFHFGTGRGAREMVLITLGTGVGAGVIVNRQLVHGAWHNAGELGHTIVALRGRPCPCGQSGCLERYSSARAVAERYAELVRGGAPATPLANRVLAGDTISSADIVAARSQDELAAQVWDEACFYLAVTCVNLQHILNPQRIVLAGGVARAGAALLDPVRTHFEELTWAFQRDRPEIVLASLGDNAGIVGAAALGRCEFATS